MKSTKSYLHSLLDALILRTIQTGEAKAQTYVIPYYELADEFKHYGAPIEADTLDLHIYISVRLGDDDEPYDTGKGFTIENKTRH
jgi:hypothetical protein